MFIKYARDQRGVAMVLELVLVAAVLTLVGVAIYQANHHSASQQASVESKKTATSAVVDTSAATAAEAVSDDIATDVQINNEADVSASEFSAADADAANLGGSFNDNSF